MKLQPFRSRLGLILPFCYYWQEQKANLQTYIQKKIREEAATAAQVICLHAKMNKRHLNEVMRKPDHSLQLCVVLGGIINNC